jgi:hypothetical protein
MENGQNQSVVNDLPFNTPINFGNNNIMVVSSNFNWGNWGDFDDDPDTIWTKLYPVIFVYGNNFSVVETHRPMEFLKGLVKLHLDNPNLDDLLKAKEKLLKIKREKEFKYLAEQK